MNISKELFEAVINEELSEIEIGKSSIVAYMEDGTEFTEDINDFFFKCKEWAYKNGYDIWSITWGACEVHNIKAYSPTKRFDADSEQQAVFDACTKILEWMD